MLRLPIYYLILVSAMYLLQDYFIYYPEKTEAQYLEQAAASRDLQLWPQDVKTYRGFISPGAPQKTGGRY